MYPNQSKVRNDQNLAKIERTSIERRTIEQHSDHLNTEQVEVCYSYKFAIQMFANQIPTVFSAKHRSIKC